MTQGRSQRLSRSQRMAFIIGAIAVVIFTTRVQAAEMFDFYNGARQMAMGGAYTGVVNDETALLTNPAGLGKLRQATLTLIDPEVEASFTNTDIVNYSNFSQALDIQKLLDLLNEAKGKHWHLKYQMFPSVVGTNFGIGLLAKYSTDAEVDEDGTVYRYDYVNDWAAALGYNFRFFGGVLKIGTTARLVDRTEVHEDLDATATNLSLSQVASEGMGLAADIGVILSIPVATLPAFSVVVRDVGNTSYTLSDGLFNQTQTRPEDSKQRIDAGFSLFPILSNNNRMTFTVDYHDITNTEEKDSMKKLHGGVEFNIHDIFFVRGGMNQRYYTAGVEFASQFFQLQATTYGEEIGTAEKPREDRRWIGKIAIRF
ncbi:MAG TPA: hypothetical protein VM432_10335 [Bdellovibrionales bacterium]|nr:hypothetical protein [Bdellovibrionales bacterium]